MIRDDEIQRLISYAKGLGLKVSFISKEKGDAAGWYLDNSAIEINKKKNPTKISTVLSLIHELGHAVHNIHEKNREIDLEFSNALGQDDKIDQRKIVLDDEIAGTKYWHDIYKETNMKFPIWKLEEAMEYDIWQYKVFYEMGKYPEFEARENKRKELKIKYKK